MSLPRPLPALLLLLSGCSTLAVGGADPASLRSATVIEACPLGVRGTHLSVVEGSDAVYVFFTTQPRYVDELRARVRDQAQVNGPGAHRGSGHLDEHEGARDHGLKLWTLGSVRVTAEDTPGGARLAVAPSDPARRASVRDYLFRRAASLESKACID